MKLFETQVTNKAIISQNHEAAQIYLCSTWQDCVIGRVNMKNKLRLARWYFTDDSEIYFQPYMNKWNYSRIHETLEYINVKNAEQFPMYEKSIVKWTINIRGY